MNITISDIILMVVPILFSVIIHEVSHGWIALKQGDTTAKQLGRLTLNPIAHIDLIGTILVPGILILTKSPFLLGWAKPVPINPLNFKNPRKGMLWVALAGPLSNITLAVISSIILRLFGHMLYGPYLNPLVTMLGYMIIFNVGLAIFNLIPIPPLDGGRVLVGILPQHLANNVARIEPYGFIILMLLIITGIINYITPIIRIICAILGVRI